MYMKNCIEKLDDFIKMTVSELLKNKKSRSCLSFYPVNHFAICFNGMIELVILCASEVVEGKEASLLLFDK